MKILIKVTGELWEMDILFHSEVSRKTNCFYSYNSSKPTVVTGPRTYFLDFTHSTET